MLSETVLPQSAASGPLSDGDSITGRTAPGDSTGGRTAPGAVGSDTDLNRMAAALIQGMVQSVDSSGSGNGSKSTAESHNNPAGSAKNASRGRSGGAAAAKRERAAGKEATTPAPVQRAKKQPPRKTTPQRGGRGEEPADVPPQARKPPGGKKRSRGRVKLENAYIADAHRRRTVFSKRKSGLIKKAQQLATLTGTQVVVLLVSETGRRYYWATDKLQPVVAGAEGKALIDACLRSAAHLPPPQQHEPSSSSTGEDPMGAAAAAFKKETSDSSKMFLEQHTKHSFHMVFNNKASLTPPSANGSMVKSTVPKPSSSSSSSSAAMMPLASAQQVIPILPAGTPCPPDTPVLTQAQLQLLQQHYAAQGGPQHVQMLQPQLPQHNIYDQQQQQQQRYFLYPAQALPYGHSVQSLPDQQQTMQVYTVPQAHPGMGAAFPQAHQGAAFPQAHQGAAFPQAHPGMGAAFPQAHQGAAFPQAHPGMGAAFLQGTGMADGAAPFLWSDDFRQQLEVVNSDSGAM